MNPRYALARAKYLGLDADAVRVLKMLSDADAQLGPERLRKMTAEERQAWIAEWRRENPEGDR